MEFQLASALSHFSRLENKSSRDTGGGGGDTRGTLKIPGPTVIKP